MGTEGILVVGNNGVNPCCFCGSWEMPVYDIEIENGKIAAMYVSELCIDHIDPQFKPEGVLVRGELTVF